MLKKNVNRFRPLRAGPRTTTPQCGAAGVYPHRAAARLPASKQPRPPSQARRRPTTLPGPSSAIPGRGSHSQAYPIGTGRQAGRQAPLRHVPSWCMHARRPACRRVASRVPTRSRRGRDAGGESGLCRRRAALSAAREASVSRDRSGLRQERGGTRRIIKKKKRKIKRRSVRAGWRDPKDRVSPPLSFSLGPQGWCRAARNFGRRRAWCCAALVLALAPHTPAAALRRAAPLATPLSQSTNMLDRALAPAWHHSPVLDRRPRL